VKANESFAKKAELSANRMELMTWEMHDIAKKTEQETVSMRVITTVTLFFLPATFIAVRIGQFRIISFNTKPSADLYEYRYPELSQW
jgi:hypothetical protein